jgi:hypothetical protein
MTRLARARLGLAPAPPRPAPSSARLSWRGPGAPARDPGAARGQGARRRPGMAPASRRGPAAASARPPV